MIDKFLREVVGSIVGKPMEEIADLLNSKKHVNEFLIAKKLEITINQTRNILYKLSDHGLVSSIRKKDKRKGWYTYFWKIEIIKSLEFLRNILLKKIDQMNNQISSRESKQFYICNRCNIEFNGENALNYNFTCNECGEIFTLRDNTKLLREFKRNLEKFKKELEFIDKEIEVENEKIDKIKQKEIKKEEKEKEAKKKAKRELNKKIKNKLLAASKKITKKKTSKKKAKKKPVKSLKKKKSKKKVK